MRQYTHAETFQAHLFDIHRHHTKAGTPGQVEALVTNPLSSLRRFYPHDVIIQFCKEEYEAMARFRSMEFAAVSLDKSDKKKFLSWAEQGDITHESALEEILAAGFKASLSFIAEQNAYCFTIVGTDNTRDHRNMCMTSWSDDYREAILIGAYKHFVICDGQTWPTHETGERWG